MPTYYRSLVLALLAALALVGLPAAQADPPHKHALLIGISDYHYQDGNLFPNLNCDEDLVRIQAALVKTFGFDLSPAKGEIIVLKTPAQTTRQEILAALDRLIAQTQAGDIVYIHYSGHGSQVPDPTRPDGLESTIVPSDYKDDQTNEITGKEIGSYLARLKKKNPAQIVLSFDSCHSGTISRGIIPTEKKRGLSYDEYVAWYQKKYRKDPPPHPSIAGNTGARGAEAALSELVGQGYVVLSACNNEESAYETADNGKDMGRLSYVLAQVLSRSGPQTTYQQVYDQVKATFIQKFADQSPQIDGDPNTYLLGGTAKETPPSILVSVDASGASGHYTLDAGSLQGMTVGSEFAIYDKNAPEFTKDHKLADAKIEAVDMTTADLTLSKKLKTDLTADSFQGARAVETAHNYASPPLTLDAASVQQAVPTQAPAILAKLAELKMVRTTLATGEKPDIALARGKSKARGTEELDIVRGDTGTILKPLDESQDLSAQVYTALQKVARYRYAVGLGENQVGLNRDYHITLRLVPAAVKKDADGHTVFDHDKPLPTNATLHTGDYFTIEVQNTSDNSLFLTVLDLGSDAEIGHPWPSPFDTTETNIILPTDPGKWVKLWRGSDKTQPAIYRATSADPHEIYKAIATDKYVSLKALVSRGADRGPSGPFSDLFGPAVDEGTRGTEDADPVDPGSWTAATYPFAVLPSSGAAALP